MNINCCELEDDERCFFFRAWAGSGGCTARRKFATQEAQRIPLVIRPRPRNDGRMFTLRPLILRLTCAVALALAASACAGGPAKNAPADAGSAWRALRAEIGAARCDAPVQCKTLAVGSKPCGGPQRFVAWSSASSDAARLILLAGQYADASRRENARDGLVSTCNVVPDPGATCQAGRCVLLPASTSQVPGPQ